MLGGAFLAQSLASKLGLRFYCTEPVNSSGKGLFQAAYRLAPGQRDLVRSENIAVVDEVVSAGSSVRATIEALQAAEAKVPVVAALLTLGGVAREYFSSRGVPLVALEHREFPLWKPADCPLCLSRVPLETLL